jgi:monoamine oxidase
MNKKTEILIIGGGLTGLTLAYYLEQSQISYKIVEARGRLGGRIYTKYSDTNAAIEMGATWIAKQQSFLLNLLQQLDLDLQEQLLGATAIYEPISTSPPQLVQLPPNDVSSYRIKGGTEVLIQTLLSKIDKANVITNEVVKTIAEKDGNLIVKTASQTLEASFVVSTLPPYLLVNTIKVEPKLPNDVIEIANKTHTWMGDSIKVGLTYEKPFWRAKNSSGTIFSNVGPIPEMYDHSNANNTKFALKGFFNGSYFSVSKAERLNMVLKQLRKYYGSQVDNYLTYEETVWRNEAFTFLPYSEHLLPHQNNGHDVFQTTYLNNKLHIAGAETAKVFSGYMEGAVRSAAKVFQELKVKTENTEI